MPVLIICFFYLLFDSIRQKQNRPREALILEELQAYIVVSLLFPGYI